MSSDRFELPELDYEAWEDTKATLHLVLQIVGKVKLAQHPKLPHWWHLTLRVTPRGVSTQSIPQPGGRSFEIALNVPRLQLELTSSEGREEIIPLAGLSVAKVYERSMAALQNIGHPTSILGKPYDNPHSNIPFAEDETHASWDHEAILRWWKVLLFLDEAFSTFAGLSFARTSPVHLFWHSFDFVVTRFSGDPAAGMGEGGRRSDVEAYSHEVVSFGWWPGDPKVRFPAFYSYTAPEPEGLSQSKLRPAEAWWQALPASHMALLKYDDLRSKEDPKAALLDFMNSAHEAGCHHAGWDQLSSQNTEPFWDALDHRFPRTRSR